PLFHRREGGRYEQLIGDIGDNLSVALRLIAHLEPGWIGGESRPFLLALGQGLPGQEVGEALIALTHQSREEPSLADAMPVPQRHRMVGEPPKQRWQSAGQALVDSKLVDHGLSEIVARSSFRPRALVSSRCGPTTTRRPSGRSAARCQ